MVEMSANEVDFFINFVYFHIKHILKGNFYKMAMNVYCLQVTHSPHYYSSGHRLLPMEISVFPLERAAQHLATHCRDANESGAPFSYSLMPRATNSLDTSLTAPLQLAKRLYKLR